MEIQVIVENTSDNNKVKGRHGLSLLITTNNTSLLYDFGPLNSLQQNAKYLGVQLHNVDIAVLSHNHIDHGGDINNFCLINKKALIHVNTDLSEKLYTKIMSFLYFPVGIKLNSKYRNRIVVHNNSEKILDYIHLVKLSKYKNKSNLNKDLYIKKNGKYRNDDFQHESAIVIEEDQELFVFCACSHHGVSKILEDVKHNFPNRKIKAFIGGFHMCNPVNKKNEKEEIIREEIEAIKKYDTNLYTGHCTGSFAFGLFTEELGNKVHKLSTGMRIEI